MARGAPRGSSVVHSPTTFVDEILSRLPVKSLLRFRCVSRRFHATITSSHVFQAVGRSRRSWPLAVCHKARSFRSLASPALLPRPRPPQEPRPPPALRLEPFHPPHLASPGHGRQAGGDLRLGHKVVRVYLVAGGDCCYYPDAAAAVCEVFALDDDEPSASWRPPAAAMTAPPPPPPHWHYPRENWRRGALLCNGDLHFLQEDGDIVTFNVTDESFGVSSLKPPDELQSCDNFELTELDGCLCLYTFTVIKWQPMDEEFEIWVMREAGSWEKLCSIEWGSMLPPDHSYLRWSWIAPLHMFSDGNDEKKKIMFAAGTGHVFVFDPSVGTLEIIFSPEDGAVGEYHNHSNDKVPTVGLFEESLALVGNTSENITFSQP